MTMTHKNIIFVIATLEISHTINLFEMQYHLLVDLFAKFNSFKR